MKRPLPLKNIRKVQWNGEDALGIFMGPDSGLPYRFRVWIPEGALCWSHPYHPREIKPVNAVITFAGLVEV